MIFQLEVVTAEHGKQSELLRNESGLWKPDIDSCVFISSFACSYLSSEPILFHKAPDAPQPFDFNTRTEFALVR
jgi:hypothetical protein